MPHQLYDVLCVYVFQSAVVNLFYLLTPVFGYYNSAPSIYYFGNTGYWCGCIAIFSVLWQHLPLPKWWQYGSSRRFSNFLDWKCDNTASNIIRFRLKKILLIPKRFLSIPNIYLVFYTSVCITLCKFGMTLCK